jgi:hypothetical protein
MEFAHAEPGGGAGCFLCTRGGELGTRWDVRIVAHSFGSVGGDDKMSFSSFAREPGQQWSDYALVIGMGKNGEDGTRARLSVSSEWSGGCERSHE